MTTYLVTYRFYYLATWIAVATQVRATSQADARGQILAGRPTAQIVECRRIDADKGVLEHAA